MGKSKLSHRKALEPTPIDSCPDCVYAYTKDTWYYTGTRNTLTSDQYKENYKDVVNASGKNYFLGMKLNSSGQIDNAYACGIINNEAFCIEGLRNGSKYNANASVLQSEKIYNNGCTDNFGMYINCNGSINAYVYNSGDVGVKYDDGDCHAYSDGSLGCK